MQTCKCLHKAVSLCAPPGSSADMVNTCSCHQAVWFTQQRTTCHPQSSQLPLHNGTEYNLLLFFPVLVVVLINALHLLRKSEFAATDVF